MAWRRITCSKKSGVTIRTRCGIFQQNQIIVVLQNQNIRGHLSPLANLEFGNQSRFTPQSQRTVSTILGLYYFVDDPLSQYHPKAHYWSASLLCQIAFINRAYTEFLCL